MSCTLSGDGLLGQVLILITGQHKAYALHMAIEQGVNHMWTISAFQVRPRAPASAADATVVLTREPSELWTGIWKWL